MNRYAMLVRVLDGIRDEAARAKHIKLYAEGAKDPEAIWQARSRAYIHLYLKVMFGLRDFAERESYVTDGAYDGGVDGYFIDTEKKQIIFIQSKLRRSESNFETTAITLDELLAVQARRIMDGETLDDCGEPYNGKILGLQRRVQEILDLGRYAVRVVILANLDTKRSASDLRRLTDGYEVEVFDFSRAYRELLLPVLQGSLFQAREIAISLDLSNKAAGSKISYSAQVPEFDCDITVVFVPIIEIARLMSEYRNSILRYNPRSYLDIVGEGVNSAVRDTVLRSNGNDFALLNNGITLICDESKVSEQSGRKHKAQFYLLNPQIINGGQTAYTLSLIYDDTPEDQRETVFSGQEVLVKAIALTPHDPVAQHEAARRTLIDRISSATNSQTAVSFADRISGEDDRIAAQLAVYERFGLLVELKRGQFGEGVRAGYIDAGEILERTLFQRLYVVANGVFYQCLSRKIVKLPYPTDMATDIARLDRFYFAYRIWREVSGVRKTWQVRKLQETLPKVYAGLVLADAAGGIDKTEPLKVAAELKERWADYLIDCQHDAGQYPEWVKANADKAKLRRQKGVRGTETVAEELERYFSEPRRSGRNGKPAAASS